jgi:hypothetical protein
LEYDLTGTVDISGAQIVNLESVTQDVNVGD